MSIARCADCLNAGAIPMVVAVANTACVGGLEQATDWWEEIVEDTLLHLGLSRDQFDLLVEEEIEAEIAYGAEAETQ
jgi:hypothetical protein